MKVDDASKSGYSWTKIGVLETDKYADGEATLTLPGIAGIILAIMIIPTIAAVTRDVFLAIPRAQREASLALGATRWETISKVLIPYGLSGILGAVILGLGRAIGETMAVQMVIGNITTRLPNSLVTGASTIARDMRIRALVGASCTARSIGARASA